MTTFNVHYETDSGKFVVPVRAETPMEAANAVRKVTPGARVIKVKVNRQQ